MKSVLAKALLACAAVSVGTSAIAQTTTTTTAPAPAAGTTTATASEVKPTSPWSAILLLDGSTGAGERQERGTDSKIQFFNYLRVAYKIDDTYSLRVDHNFELSSIPDEAERAQSTDDRAAGKSINGYSMMDPAIGLAHKMPSLLGSEAYSIGHRYYVPVTGMNRVGEWDSNNRLGMYRFTAEVPWVLNPRWTVSYTIDPRISFAEAQSAMSFRQYGNLYYNVNDKVQPYATVGTLRGIGSQSVKKPMLGEDFWSGRKQSDRGYAAYGLNLSPSKAIDLSAGYETLWSIAEGAESPFLYDNSSYIFTAIFKM